MQFEYSEKVKSMQTRLLAFMDEHIYPNEARFFQEIADNRAKGNAWIPTKIVEELKPKARAAGLWNLFLPKSPRAPQGLSNLEYAPLCEIMGRVPFAAEIFNCAAPDTGNMETFERYASEELKPKIFGIVVYRCELVHPRVEIRSWNWVPERVRAPSLARCVVRDKVVPESRLAWECRPNRVVNSI